MTEPVCPTVCDNDCEELCHEAHEVDFKKDHRPDLCVKTIETFRTTSWLKWSPAMHRGYMAALERSEREIERDCWAGNCTEFYDPVEKRVTGGWGPVGCPCDTYKYPTILETPERSRMHTLTHHRYRKRVKRKR